MDVNELIENYSGFFVSEVCGESLWIKLSGNFYNNIVRLDKRDFIQNYFKKVNQSQHIKTVIIQAPYSESGVDEYLDFILESCPERNLGFVMSDVGSNSLHRYCNIINQIIDSIINLNKLVIHICQGNTISLFMSLGLACDYRIITEDTLFHNVYQKAGMIPKGGGPFFLSNMLGKGKAYQLLLLNQQITAEQAFKHGIVDHVAEKGHLEEVATQVANAFNKNHIRTLLGMKRLINYPSENLKQYLEFESKEVLRVGAQIRFAES